MSDRRREYAKLLAAWTDFGKIDKNSARNNSIEGLRLESSDKIITVGKVERLDITEDSFGFALI